LIIFTTSGNQTGEGHLSPPVILHRHEAMPRSLLEELAERCKISQRMVRLHPVCVVMPLKGHEATNVRVLKLILRARNTYVKYS
jgi:hypothetical protein